jgi:murein DD-endopeptidase MepM/ murein hydrolase activator NlpD
MRRHPILGYTKLHKGLDFAAPRGTPIYAAGDGVIIQKGRSRANGNYLRLRHKNGYETAYLHMNNFAAGIRKGKRVSQGQVIGGVGSTGLATGPHLHYEVVLRGKPINPRTLDLPPSIALNDTGRKRLASVQKEIEAQIRALTSGNQFASSR